MVYLMYPFFNPLSSWSPEMMKAVLVVHGGAWAIPDVLAEASVEGVKAAAREGYGVLGTGGSALDAVEKAVRAMEDNTVFDAGEHLLLLCWLCY